MSNPLLTTFCSSTLSLYFLIVWKATHFSKCIISLDKVRPKVNISNCRNLNYVLKCNFDGLRAFAFTDYLEFSSNDQPLPSLVYSKFSATCLWDFSYRTLKIKMQVFLELKSSLYIFQSLRWSQRQHQRPRHSLSILH